MSEHPDKKCTLCALLSKNDWLVINYPVYYTLLAEGYNIVHRHVIM